MERTISIVVRPLRLRATQSGMGSVGGPPRREETREGEGKRRERGLGAVPHAKFIKPQLIKHNFPLDFHSVRGSRPGLALFRNNNENGKRVG